MWVINLTNTTLLGCVIMWVINLQYYFAWPVVIMWVINLTNTTLLGRGYYVGNKLN